MKRFLLFCICVCFALSCCGVTTAFAAERTQIFLGKTLPGDCGSVVYQPTYSVSEGGSSVKYALETPSNNKFVRMANFDASYLCDYTAIAVVCSDKQIDGVARISLKYRLYEGDADYLSSDVVVCISFRNGCKQFTYAELTTNASGDFTWKTLQADIAVEHGLTSNYISVEFCFGNASKYADGKTCLDVDRFSLEVDGKEQCVDGDFDCADVTSEGDPDTDYVSDENVIEASKALMLSADNLSYRVNTVYSDSVNIGFDAFSAARTLPAGKNKSLYTDSASGSQYLVYDQNANNTFLRMGNFDATKNSLLVRLPFADNDIGSVGNIPQASQLYVNFDYRLFFDEEALLQADDSDVVLEFSTRRSTLNNSGKFTLDNLKVNSQGDGSWNNMSCVLQTRLGSTAFVEIIFYSPSLSDCFTKTYIDIDNVYISNLPSGKNYACDNGTWEGTVKMSEDGTTPMNPLLVFNENYGVRSKISLVSGVDYDMLMPVDGTFGILYGKPSASGVYDVVFDVAANDGDKIDLLFDGRGGYKYQAIVGQNTQNDNISVVWNKTDDGYRCCLSYAKYDKQPLTRIDFVNRSSQSLNLDNLFIGQVSSVCNESGDYASFVTEVERLQSLAAQSSLNKQSQKSVDNALYLANKLNEFASQARMDDAVGNLLKTVNGATKKADLTELNKTIALAEEKFTDGKNYTKVSIALMKDSYFAAKQLTENSLQEDVDNANVELQKTISNLAEYNKILTVATVGGLTVVSAAAIVFKRNKKETDHE